jgi:hypothetical protein
MDRITHVVDGEEYEIRTMRDEQTQELAVGVFKDNQRIGPRYTVSFEMAGDFKRYTGGRAFEKLVELAKSDLDNGIVDPFSRVEYRGYVIRAYPHQLVEIDHWTIDIDIERHAGATITVKQFSTNGSFPTRRDAVKRCIDFGKQVIDGSVEGYTAP